MVINVTESNGVQEVTFGTGPFYLEYSYQRAAEAAIRAAEESLTDDSNPNGNIYQIVTNICRAEGVNSGWNAYLECWTRELEKFPAAEELGSTTIAASIPSTELYRKNYASNGNGMGGTNLLDIVCNYCSAPRNLASANNFVDFP